MAPRNKRLNKSVHSRLGYRRAFNKPANHLKSPIRASDHFNCDTQNSNNCNGNHSSNITLFENLSTNEIVNNYVTGKNITGNVKKPVHTRLGYPYNKVGQSKKLNVKQRLGNNNNSQTFPEKTSPKEIYYNHNNSMKNRRVLFKKFKQENVTRKVIVVPTIEPNLVRIIDPPLNCTCKPKQCRTYRQIMPEKKPTIPRQKSWMSPVHDNEREYKRPIFQAPPATTQDRHKQKSGPYNTEPNDKSLRKDFLTCSNKYGRDKYYSNSTHSHKRLTSSSHLNYLPRYKNRRSDYKADIKHMKPSESRDYGRHTKYQIPTFKGKLRLKRSRESSISPKRNTDSKDNLDHRTIITERLNQCREKKAIDDDIKKYKKETMLSRNTTKSLKNKVKPDMKVLQNSEKKSTKLLSNKNSIEQSNLDKPEESSETKCADKVKPDIEVLQNSQKKTTKLLSNKNRIEQSNLDKPEESSETKCADQQYENNIVNSDTKGSLEEHLTEPAEENKKSLIRSDNLNSRLSPVSTVLDSNIIPEDNEKRHCIGPILKQDQVCYFNRMCMYIYKHTLT